MSATAARRTPGKRLALYWIGGFFAVGLLSTVAARVINPEGFARMEAERAREAALVETRQAAAKQAEQKEADDEKTAGMHCLSGWDGSNRSLKTMVRDGTRNPDSFEHIDTRIMPAVANEKTGRLEHAVVMRFRAQNGFGGMNVGVAVASVDNVSCDATLISLSER